METRVAVISIIVEDIQSAEALNGLLHQYGDMIIGRMGMPYRDRGIHLISVVVDGSLNRINGLTGALGRLQGVTAKALYAKV